MLKITSSKKSCIAVPSALFIHEVSLMAVESKTIFVKLEDELKLEMKLR
jgi:hypothetical protein